ncbi:MAG: PadR family transcriptional regulator [Rhodothermaceae bacterium]
MKLLTRKEEMVLLAIYHQEGKSSLVEVREYLLEQANSPMQISTIHAVLDRLEKSGYLKSGTGAPTFKRGGKAVKFYEFTKKGKEALAELKAVTEALWKGVNV